MNPALALLDPHVYPISSSKLILKFHVASNGDICSDGMNHVLNLFGFSIYIQKILSMILIDILLGLSNLCVMMNC